MDRDNDPPHLRPKEEGSQGGPGGKRGAKGGSLGGTGAEAAQAGGGPAAPPPEQLSRRREGLLHLVREVWVILGEGSVEQRGSSQVLTVKKETDSFCLLSMLIIWVFTQIAFLLQTSCLTFKT